jgi:hypothetical protein
MKGIISTDIYIDKYQYFRIGCRQRMTHTEKRPMDTNTNIAAWMIAGGLKSADAARDRNLAHLWALRASQETTPGIVRRLSAAIAAIRLSATPAEPACCPA